MRYLGAVTPENRWLYRRTLETMRLKPWQFFRAVRDHPNIVTVGALLTTIKTLMLAPRKARKVAENWRRGWQKACQELENPGVLIQAAPESLPYRDEEQIRGLFSDLGIAVQGVHVLGGCVVAQI